MTKFRPQILLSIFGVIIFLLIPLVDYAQLKESTAQANPCKIQAGTDSFSQYVGRFSMSDGTVLIVEESGGELTMHPIFWRSVQSLHRLDGDNFGIEERADRRISFVRDAKGCVSAVKIVGFGDDGTFSRIGNDIVPIELLLSGHPEVAAEQMFKADPNGIENYVNFGQTLLQRFPSKSTDAVKFLAALSKRSYRTSSVYAALGDAYVATDNRKLAVKSYLKALDLEAKNETALKGLRRLHALPKNVFVKASGWSLPFSLNKLFEKPTKLEIKAVETDWAKRDLSPQNIAEEARRIINLGYTQAVVRIISHSVHGQKHYGAIIIPDGIEGKAPVVLDLKGVSPDYFPLDLNQLHSPRFLGHVQNKFVYFVPSFRGEVLNFDGKVFISEGDRTDVWDGAADDSLAFLNAALSVTPQADAERICAFGKSRGGTLALLAGIRNRKIKLVVDWSGPVDFFELMATGGWTEQEIITDGLLNKAAPKDDGGQFIETYLSKAIQGKWNLEQVRLKMLAGSPLYFAEKLPRTQIYYGIEDEMVPVKNGYAIDRVMRKSHRDSSKFQSFFFPNAGHDLNNKMASSESKKFLLSLLAAKE